MSRFWSDLAHSLKPYVPGEQPKITNLVKLNTNENPFPPSPKAVAAMQAATGDDLRLYPDPTCSNLRQALADYTGLSMDQVFVGNGSDEVLAHAFQGLLKQDDKLLFPDITYGFYPVYGDLFGIDYQAVALADDLSIDVEDYIGNNGGVIIANPNAPTGELLSLDSIRTLLQGNPDRVVIIDEAYIDFGGESAVALVPEFDNLLVVQTLSKSRSLAGLRVGMAFGQAHLVQGLERIKNSFNPYPLSREALAGATASIEDVDYFNATRQAIIAQREELSRQLSQLGFSMSDSKANFVFVEHAVKSAADIAAGLREQGVIVRHLTASPRTQNRLRISIGTPAECQTLLTALQTLL
ncbi:MAG TPA: histidinol-phosphate transaminase [Oceanospirillaceae bacterium]|nr:histidinol-phosphate transaminase [Oceanospirillaceae bacterium]